MNTITLWVLILLCLRAISGICETPDSLIQRGVSLHGSFVDADGGHPISGVLVRVASEKIESVYPDRDFIHETETDAEGTFWLTIPNEQQIYYAFSCLL